MVVNDKALVREMKDAYKGWGYTVMRLPGDRWVFMRKDTWIVEIEGQNNVPNAVLSLIVLHMGNLPEVNQCYRIYKSDKCTAIQKEVYTVAEQAYLSFEKMRQETDDDPVVVRRTSLLYGSRRVWQQKEDKRILLINPRYEGLIKPGPNQIIRTVGANIYTEGEISCVYISCARGGANEELLDHLAQVKWT